MIQSGDPQHSNGLAQINMMSERSFNQLKIVVANHSLLWTEAIRLISAESCADWDFLSVCDAKN